jgi:hypothetical protein
MLSALIYITETPNKQDCMPGLLLLGLVYNLRSTYKLVENISRTLLKNSTLWSSVGAGIISKIQEIMTYAWDTHLNALTAFMHADADLALKAKKNYPQFCDKLIHLRATVYKSEGMGNKTILELLKDVEQVAVKSSSILRLT